MMDKYSIATFLEIRRKAAGKTLEHLSRETNIPQTTVFRLVNGKCDHPSVENVKLLVEAVGSNMKELEDFCATEKLVEDVIIGDTEPATAKELVKSIVESSADPYAKQVTDLHRDYSDMLSRLSMQYEAQLSTEQEKYNAVVEQYKDQITTLREALATMKESRDTIIQILRQQIESLQTTLDRMNRG